MAWFSENLGKNLANITQSVSNFTKEVLNDSPDDPAIPQPGQYQGAIIDPSSSRPSDFDPEEFKKAKELIIELENICEQQKFQIEQLENDSRTKLHEISIKSDDTEERIKAVQEQFFKKISSQEEENRLQKQLIERLEKEVEQSRNNELIISSSSISTGTDTCETCEVETQTIVVEVEETLKDQDHIISTTNNKADNYVNSECQTVEPYLDMEYHETVVRELEERCSSYQTDLYDLRGELLGLQRDVDENAEARAQLNDEMLGIFRSAFLLDGQPVLDLPKELCSSVPGGGGDVGDCEKFILILLRQLSTLWRDLVEKKGTLERTVTRLSHNQKERQLERDVVDLSFKEKQLSPAQIADFLPAKMDSFGLDTIEEEEKDEPESGGNKQDGGDSGPVAFIHKPKQKVQSQTTETETETELEAKIETVIVEKINFSTQTDQETEENYQEKEEDWLRKEFAWKEEGEAQEERINRLDSELQRLRAHLMELEDQSTNDAVFAEEREKVLRDKISKLEKEVVQSNQENDRIEGLREELGKMRIERDRVRQSTSSLEEHIAKLNTQSQNLHFVLEQFQKDKDTEIEEIERSHKNDMRKLMVEKDKLSEDLSVQIDLLGAARAGLEAAQSLNIQIEEKARIILQLKNTVSEKEAEILKLNDKMGEITSNLGGKIDRYLVKNLFVGYFSTPPDKRKEVLKVIATVLDFNREDRQKSGLEAGGTYFWPFKGASFLTGNQSISEAFIKFLESESQPSSLPQDQQQQQTTGRPQAESSISSSKTTEDLSTRRDSSSSSREISASPSVSSSQTPRDSPTSFHQQQPQPTSSIAMSLPVFNQTDRSNSILKDVLNPKP